MRDYRLEGDPPMAEGKSNGGFLISHATGFFLILLAVCLSVLVGLLVHLASPSQVVCTCNTPEQAVPPIGAEELRRQCVELIEGGDLEICTSCPKEVTSSGTTETTMWPTTTHMENTTDNWTTNTTTSTTAAATTSTTTIAPEPINYRLPTSISPFHYNIEIQPEIYGDDPEFFTFNGSVEITLNVTEATSLITFHKEHMHIDTDSVSLVALQGASTAPLVVNTTYDEVTNFYVLHLDSDLDPGNSYKVGMTYNGNMTDSSLGLFYGSYEDGNTTVYMASTQFQSNFARRAFPCFDDPSMKVTFDVTVVRKNTTDRDYITLSNTDIVASENRGEYVADMYATTPLMTTYTLAFIVCDFDYLENITSNITYRTYAKPTGIQYAGRAHEYGLQLFDWYEEKFDPNYPLDKMDSIAVPGFIYGGMEHWGLVTYHEDILYVPGVSPASYDQWTFDVTSHEIAHHWFGNLVTMKWWYWAWINEGFASYFEVHGVDQVQPDRRAEDQFVAVYMHSVMADDASPDSHPLTNDGDSTDDIEAYFDDITYLKGGSIVRMMHFVMGDDLFYKGLNHFLAKRQYTVVEERDLWNDLTEATIQDGRIINTRDKFITWTTQKNFPLVTVTVIEAGVMQLRQQRFLNDMSLNVSAETGTYRYRWSIPVTFATSANSSNFEKDYQHDEIDWLHHTELLRNFTDESIEAPGDNNDSWVIVNLHQTGFYRVNYDDDNWLALVRQLEHNITVIPAINRAQIINDAWSLQKAGVLNMSIALRTFNFLKNEVDYVTWRAFARELPYLEAMLKRTTLYGAFQEFMRVSTVTTFNHHGMNIDEHTVPIDVFQITRGSGYACKYGNTGCRQEALRQYRELMVDPVNNRLDRDLLGVVICNAVRYGGMAEWNFAFHQYTNSDESAISSNSLVGMACTKQAWLLERMLDMAVDNTKIDEYDAGHLIGYVAKQPSAQEMTWNFVKKNYQMMGSYLGEDTLLSTIQEVTYGYNTEDMLAELEEFATSMEGKSMDLYPITEAIKTTKKNILWMNEHYDVIRKWLVEIGYNDYLP